MTEEKARNPETPAATTEVPAFFRPYRRCGVALGAALSTLVASGITLADDRSAPDSTIYASRASGVPLFSDNRRVGGDAKFLEFSIPMDTHQVFERAQALADGRTRVNLYESLGGTELGYVVEDGTPPKGKRFVVRRAALVGLRAPVNQGDSEQKRGADLAFFAGKRAWEAAEQLRRSPGVLEVQQGYQRPQRDVAASAPLKTLRVQYDPKAMSYSALVQLYLRALRQAPGRNDDASAVVLVRNPEQARAAQALRDQLEFAEQRSDAGDVEPISTTAVDAPAQRSPWWLDVRPAGRFSRSHLAEVRRKRTSTER